MIRALAHGPGGAELVLGLTHTNLDKLADGRPIRVQAQHVDPHGPDFQVWLLGGADPRAIEVELARQVGVIAPPGADIGGGWLRFTTAARGAPVAVLGIGDAAATNLRRGVQHRYRPEIAHAPRITVLAAASTDAITGRLVAGGYRFDGAVVVDARGGRDD